jgi:hypothetical protein
MFNKNFICIIGFFIINLYKFLLCILNNFLKTYLKIITEGFTDGLYPSTFDREREMSIIPTNLQTELVRQHFTIAATITNEYIDGYLRSVFHTLTDNVTDDLFHRYFTQSLTK